MDGLFLRSVGLRAFRKAAFIKELFETGEVVPVIDRNYLLSETAEAIRYLEEGHAQGKVVISVEHNDKT